MNEILDASGGVLRLIALSTDIIQGLNRLCQRYKRASYRLHGMAVQMLAMRTALNRIDELARAEATARHHQLVMDIDTSMAFCDTLLTKLNREINALDDGDRRMLDMTFKRRLKTAFNGGPVGDMEAMLDRQTNALSLLLTTFSCQTLREQAQFLQRPKSRTTMDSVVSDAASLRGYRDGDSVLSQLTDRMSKLSREFDFDGTLLSSRVYSFQSALLISLLQHRLKRDTTGGAAPAAIAPRADTFEDADGSGDAQLVDDASDSDLADHGSDSAPLKGKPWLLVVGSSNVSLQMIADAKWPDNGHKTGISTHSTSRDGAPISFAGTTTIASSGLYLFQDTIDTFVSLNSEKSPEAELVLGGLGPTHGVAYIADLVTCMSDPEPFSNRTQGYLLAIASMVKASCSLVCFFLVNSDNDKMVDQAETIAYAILRLAHHQDLKINFSIVRLDWEQFSESPWHTIMGELTASLG